MSNAAVQNIDLSGLQAPLLALVGNPNCGKTALFNRLTGSRQKVANYAGVTVERKEGRLTTPRKRRLRILDLPGTYSLEGITPDELVTCSVLRGEAAGETRPDLVIAVVDATNLRRNLRIVLGIRRLGLPVVVALNMVDLARRQGLNIDPAALQRELGVPVVQTVAVDSKGADTLVALLDDEQVWKDVSVVAAAAADAARPGDGSLASAAHIAEDHREVQRILVATGLDGVAVEATLSDRIDRVALHPVAGPLLLLALLFLIFQAVFAWAEWPMGQIEAGTTWLGELLTRHMSDGLLRSLLVDGVIAGAGGVLVFLPQILILFFFILVLEESGYLPRAAFLLDRIMGGIGLSGRSFIPLLSSFACAIPGIMATRTINNQRDRLVTIMIAPLMTCSARLPVYALLIGAFIPRREVWGVLELQGLVLFGLYLGGIVSAMAVAWVLKWTSARGQTRQLMMELPAYHWPAARNLAIGLWQRAQIFITRVGTIILALTILLWFLSTFPAPPEGATLPPIDYSFAGRLGHLLAPVFQPIGFNWQIVIALIPGLAAREVAVSALGTVYALSATGDEVGNALAPLIAQSWSLATAMSLLAWYVFAPQCLATLATVKRETGGWRAPLLMAGYLFGLAYLASFLTYRAVLAWGT
ncbi:MAG: ferrous iron transport protein B [Aquabacterium sp.]|jgi:ferrous iron transport protein B|nr:MAG: ferrous iron transport protein B [Aquabacterium sp.]